MTIQEIADGLVALCRENKFQQAQETFYADDAASIEPEQGPNPTVTGLTAIIQKGNYFQQAFTFHHNEVSEPLVAGNYFTLRLTSDVTQHESGQRMTIDELVMYRVRDGKIISEQFFY
jgi:hypothetical protein